MAVFIPVSKPHPIIFKPMSASRDPYLYYWPHSALHKNSKWRATEALFSERLLPETTTELEQDSRWLNHRSTDFACALRNEVEDCLKNLEETFKQCLKVAEQGDAGVQFIVGYAYRSGKGVEKDDGLTLL